MASFVNPKLWSAAFWFLLLCRHCGIFEMLVWEHQCIISDLERSGEGSIELVAWGQKYIILILERSGDGSNKWKLFYSAWVVESRG